MRFLPQLKACQNKAVKPLVTFFVKFSREKVQIAIRCKCPCTPGVQVIFDQLVAFVLLWDLVLNTAWAVVSVLCRPNVSLLSTSRAGVIFLGGVEESLPRIVQTSISPVSAPLSSFLAPATLFASCPAGSFVTVNITSVFGPKSNGCVLWCNFGFLGTMKLTKRTGNRTPMKLIDTFFLLPAVVEISCEMPARFLICMPSLIC
jgi:hypothetical protein